MSKKRNTDNHVVKLLLWIFYGLVIPLLPMALGVLIAVMQARGIDYRGLLSGTELFLLSLAVSASTKNDFDNAKLNIKQSVRYSAISSIILPLMIFLAIMAFTVVYLQERQIADVGLNEEVTLNVALVTSISTSVVCVCIQAFIAFVNSK